MDPQPTSPLITIPTAPLIIAPTIASKRKCHNPERNKPTPTVHSHLNVHYIPLQLSAIIMEDNSAVVTMVNSDTAYTKKCKHFMMVVNYVKEQIALRSD